MVFKGHGATVGELYKDMFVAAAAAAAMSNVNVHMVMRVQHPPASIPKCYICRRNIQNKTKVVESNRAHIVVEVSSSGPNTIFDFRKFKDFSIFGVFPLASTSIVMPEPHSAVGGRTIRAVSV